MGGFAFHCAFNTKGYFEKLSFRPISSLFEKFYPRNIDHMPAVKFFKCLDIERKP